jgi:hypothetical protein
MSWSTSEALTDPAIRAPTSFHSEYKFHLRDIPTEITLRLYNPLHSSAITIRQSHMISVPDLEPQEQAACEDETQEGEVLQKVISAFVCVYNAALAQGLKPEPSWLRPSPDFC